MTRVVAGSARGVRLDVPSGGLVRPTTDRVREATFNALGSLDLVVGARVLDLFAGSGAMGIEALSRGAAHATFVDSDRAALAAVAANLERTKLIERATVVRADSLRWLGEQAERFELAILDPPYAFEDWDALLGALRADAVVIEAPIAVPPGVGWSVMREKRYGSTVVTIAAAARRQDPGPAAPGRTEGPLW